MMEVHITQTTLNQQIAAAANSAAGENALLRYRLAKAANTMKSQRKDITLFAQFLASTGMRIDWTHDESGHEIPIMFTDVQAWQDCTHGLVKAFQLQLATAGYAIGSMNRIVSTIKKYASLADLPADEHMRIKAIECYSRKEGMHVDEKRIITRRGAKKALPTSIDHDTLSLFLRLPALATYQQARDTLMLCLMIEMGLRVSEVHSLTLEQFNLKEKQITFYREKVGKIQTHDLPTYTLAAAIIVLAMIEHGSPWLTVTKGGKIGAPMSTRAMQKRITYLFAHHGLAKVSPHDLRHAWATDMLRSGTDIKSMMSAGGWNSPAMPLRYVEESKIANEGVKQGW